HPARGRRMGLAQEMRKGMRPAGRYLEHAVEQIARQAAGELPEVAKQLPRRVGIRQRTMGMPVLEAELPRQVWQAVTGRHREKHPGQVQGVKEIVGLAGAVAVDQVGEVEVAAVGHDRTLTDEVDELSDHHIRVRRRGHIDIANTGELLDRAGDRDFGANQRLEAGQHLIALEPNRADLEIGRHTSELQSLAYLVCRLLLEKKKKTI